jgi:hypothetical protein
MPLYLVRPLLSGGVSPQHGDDGDISRRELP